MKKLILSGLVCGVLASSLMAGQNQGWQIDMEAKYQDVNLYGDFSLGRLGTQIDIEKDLGVKSTGVVIPTISLTNGVSTFHIDYENIEVTGAGTLGSVAIIDGDSFVGDINTSLKYRSVNFGYDYKILETTYVDGYIGMDLNYLKLQSELTTATQFNKQTQEVIVPIPNIGFDFKILPNLKAVTSAAYIGDLGSNHYYDLQAGLDYEVIKDLHLTSGYRIKEVKFDMDNNTAELGYRGGNVGLKYIF